MYCSRFYSKSFRYLSKSCLLIFTSKLSYIATAILVLMHPLSSSLNPKYYPEYNLPKDTKLKLILSS